MAGMHVSKYHAVLRQDRGNAPAGRAVDLGWRLVAPIFRRSRPLRAFFYELPRSRLRTALVVRYYRDIVRDMATGDIARHLRAIDAEAEVSLFRMETFSGRSGAEAALRQWRESFPDLDLEMAEFINPDGPNVVCVGRLVGGGATSGATVALQLVFTITVVGGMAVGLRLSDSKREALEAVGLRE